MQPTPVPDPALSDAWRDVLDRMEQALARVEAEAAAREQALQAAPALPLPDPERLAGLVQQLAPAETWLEPLQASVRQVEQLVGETNAVLQTEENALRGWLAAVAETRQRLADWEARNPRGGI